MTWNGIMIMARYINLSSKIKVLSEYSTIDADASKHSSIYTNTDRPHCAARNKHSGLTRHELVKIKYVIVYVAQ